MATNDSAGYVLGSKLYPIVEIWLEVEALLGLSRKQAADFVETQFRENGLTLYRPLEFDETDQQTGIWEPVSAGSEHNYLVDAWASAANHGWTDASIVQWRFLRITPSARNTILGRAKGMLDQDLDQSRDATAGSAALQRCQWPWGMHDTKLLGDLAAAAERWWSRYDPDDYTTAHTNDEVSAWLVKERGTSARMADAIASILRADGLPSGPRK